ncbi:hypothetical protein B4U80_07891, partial [Leptotrombidium deliense]
YSEQIKNENKTMFINDVCISIGIPIRSVMVLDDDSFPGALQACYPHHSINHCINAYYCQTIPQLTN